MKKLIIVFLFTLSALSYGQDKIAITEDDYSNNKIEMADGIRADGKIYVVVAIVLVILFGLLGYITMIDRNLSKLEKEHEVED